MSHVTFKAKMKRERNKEGEEREAKEVVLEYLRLVNFYCNEAGASCCLVM